MKGYAPSPLRYPGGKSKALPKILAHIPADIREFREPFVGGGSVFLTLRQLFGKQITRCWINDLNSDLIALWCCLRDDPDTLIEQISAFKLHYTDGRALFAFLTSTDTMRSNLDRAVRFFILNRITFSGTVDSGGYSQQAFERRFTESSLLRLRGASRFLQGAHITADDYERVLREAGENVFIFLDPPYLSATDSRLYGVRGVLHTTFDHERLAAVLRECPHRWLMTYDDSEAVRNLYDFATITTWEHQYGMNNFKQAIAAKGREIFIRNY